MPDDLKLGCMKILFSKNVSKVALFRIKLDRRDTLRTKISEMLTPIESYFTFNIDERKIVA